MTTTPLAAALFPQQPVPAGPFFGKLANRTSRSPVSRPSAVRRGPLSGATLLREPNVADEVVRGPPPGQSSRAAFESREAWAVLAQALFISNEFLFVDLMNFLIRPEVCRDTRSSYPCRPFAFEARFPRVAGQSGVGGAGPGELPLLGGGRLVRRDSPGPISRGEGEAGDLPPDGRAGRRTSTCSTPSRGSRSTPGQRPDGVATCGPSATTGGLLPLAVRVRGVRARAGSRSASLMPHLKGVRRRPLRPPRGLRLESESRPGDQLHRSPAGSTRPTPAWAAWVSYGLGTENQEPAGIRGSLGSTIRSGRRGTATSPASTRGRRSTWTSPAPTR